MKFFEKNTPFSASFGAPMPERSYRLVMKKGPNYGTNPTDVYPAYVNSMEPLGNIASENVKFRFGFSDKEKDDEIKGNGNSYDFGDRMYDPRIGRWLACDAKSAKYPAQSSYDYCLNNPLIFVDPDGNVVKPAPGKATEIWNQYKANASKIAQSYIKVLEESDVTYTINYATVADDPGGMTTWASTNNPNPDQQVIQIDIFALQGQEEKAWAYNALGDEVVGAVQFDKGEIGFAVKTNKDGVDEVIATGYDWLDEVESKEGAIDAAKSNKVDLVSSAKDYDKNVKRGKMKAENWIQKYKREDGASYKKIFKALGGEGLTKILSGHTTGAGVEVQKEGGSPVKGFIFRRGDKRNADGKTQYKTVVKTPTE